MQKLKVGIIDKMIMRQATSAEVDFLICISQYQDNTGRINGVYYKVICERLQISPQTFYNVLRSLEQKKIIKTHKSFYIDWDIVILNNDFSGQELRPGKHFDHYIDMGRELFSDPKFLALKAKEKLLAILFLKIASAGSPSYHVGVQHFFETYTRLFQVKKRALQNYLTSLRQFFSIGIKEGQYWISPFVRHRKRREYAATDKEKRAELIAGSLCRRYRLESGKGSESIYHPLKELTEQYTYQLMDKLEGCITEAVKGCLKRMNGTTDPKKWKRRSISPNFIHMMLNEQKVRMM